MKKAVQRNSRQSRTGLNASICCMAVFFVQSAAAQTIPNVPLIATQSSTPLSMLVVGRDHTLFYEAYNDASDIDGDGVLDVRFDPEITYYGLFDSNVCYSHSGGSGNGDQFTPSSFAGTLGTCSGGWSGNWLNYATTSRIDALRKVFYGGHREVDEKGKTVLRRSYIPQDAHSWAKEYTSVAVDGYDISKYTPLALPNTGSRHFFGNLTANAGIACTTLESCSGLPPLLRVITNTKKRVWEWASTERPVLHPKNNHGGTRTDYTVRVEVCVGEFTEGCKRYPNGSLKPIGLLHEYGENDAMLFGLLTGSYNKNMSGGVLRKVVSSFRDEVDEESGIFKADATIVNSLSALRIRDFNNNRKDNAYRGGWLTTAEMSEQKFADWGNPVGEMMYEALRYFAGKKSPTSAFDTSGGLDADIGLTRADWDDPYDREDGAAKAHWCAKPNMLVVSGINPSFDSDQLPGTAFGSFSGDLSGLNVSSVADQISSGEGNISGTRYIGQVGADYDGAPTAKSVSSLGNIRGLAPEEPTKQGSYYSASVAHFGKTAEIRTDLDRSPSVDTYAVVLSSTLPRISAPTTSGRTITLVPFAKSTSGSGISITKGKFQPTNQIVDFYVDTIVNTNPADTDLSINDGRYYAKFRINFEDVEQGADHDMDAIVVYEISAQADGSLRVRLEPTYQAGGIRHSMGYVISGTTSDGVYLVVQDENVDGLYYLNVPPGMSPGDCDVANAPNACKRLPTIGQASDRIFSPGSSPATLLRDPLWYAAKWGGFVDRNGNDRPDLPLEWDSDNDSVPDTYFLVQNPLKLREALKKSFDTIVQRSASTGNITSNGQQLRAESRVFQTQFSSESWSGEVIAYSVTSSGVSETPIWQASEVMPSASVRNLITWNPATLEGVEFSWDALPPELQVEIGSPDLLNYVRGDRSKEVNSAGTLRTREKVLADIVHSSPYYVKETNTVFVGSNGGMLHAFDANTGVELFGYVPNMVFDKLVDLSDVNYGHHFYVDGDISVIPASENEGTSVLIASTGRGAKGLFALDVTDPGAFDEDSALWEFAPDSDTDLGFVLGRPQIGTVENGAKVVVFGNGYQSTSGKAALYFVDLEDGSLYHKMVADDSSGGGLATPTLLDTDGDNLIDTIYAGDHKGQVWKFDVTGAKNSWKSSLLFQAVDEDGVAQPITAQLTVVKNPITSDDNYGKTFVFFGTGSFIFDGDKSDTQVQTWYGLIDDGKEISDRSELAQRTFISKGTVAANTTRVVSEAVANDMSGKLGWYLDMQDPVVDPALPSERIVTRSLLFTFLEPVLIASSIIPNDDPCMSGGRGYVNAINPFNGARLEYPPFDLNNDGKFDDGDKQGGDDVIGSFDPNIGMPGEGTLVGDRFVVAGSEGTIEDVGVPLGAKRLGRISWREIVGD